MGREGEAGVCILPLGSECPVSHGETVKEGGLVCGCIMHRRRLCWAYLVADPDLHLQQPAPCNTPV